MGSLSLDYFIHAANILLLAAYSVRDILWLRLFAVASSLIAMPYFLFQPTPLWAAFGWSVLFAGINIFQSWRVFLERRPVRLTPEEEEVRRLAFRCCSQKARPWNFLSTNRARIRHLTHLDGREPRFGACFLQVQ